MNPTPEQLAILDFVRTSRANLMLRARAGCGKTSTLKLIDATLPPSSAALVICFNKSIADEARKSKSFRSATQIKTMNSIGHSIWAEFSRRELTLSKTKILDIYRAIVDDADRAERKHLWTLWDAVKEATDMARATGYIPATHARADRSLYSFRQLEHLLDATPTPEIHGLVDRVLTESIRLAFAGTVDFNDQCYMPALFGGIFPTFPTVLVDEYQDLSPINRALVAKLCRSSRQIGVGDEAQAIYEFRGADAMAMPRAINEFEMAVLPLSVSFRCPSAITSNVHWHVPDIQSFRSGGIVEELPEARPLPGSAVICRYNAPLLHMAFNLFASGSRVDVAGIDIGARVIKILGKLGDESQPRSQTLAAIDDWEAERNSLDSKTAADTAACLRVFVRATPSLGLAIAYARRIFDSTPAEDAIRFMSGHRAKGLEFPHVYHLNRSGIKQGGQEQNIHYVVDTRARERLTYIGD